MLGTPAVPSMDTLMVPPCPTGALGAPRPIRVSSTLAGATL
jgi:hypothetical protein